MKIWLMLMLIYCERKHYSIAKSIHQPLNHINASFTQLTGESETHMVNLESIEITLTGKNGKKKLLKY